MLTRIELKNFMSHEHTVIEPARGLTVLIGPNNVGKSAIIAALQILCYNGNSTYVKRHGTKVCSVTVETDDGHTIEWKRKASASYTVDGETFDRIGRDVPPEVHDVLRLPKVDTNEKDEFDVHFGSQKTPIFLLDSTGSTAARFFASSSDAIRLVQMQKRHAEKIRDNRKEKTRLEKESDEVNAALEVLEPVARLAKSIDGLETDYDQIIHQHDEMEELSDDLAEMERYTHEVAQYSAELSAIAGLSKPPVLDDVDLVSTTLAELKSSILNHAVWSRKVDALLPMKPFPEFGDVDALGDLIAQSNGYSGEISGSTAMIAAFEPFAEPPVLSDPVPLNSLIEQMEDDSRRVRLNGALSSQLQSLEEPPPIVETEPIADTIVDLNTTEQQQQRWQREHALLEEIYAIEVVSSEPLEEFVAEYEEQVHEVQRVHRVAEIVSKLERVPEEVDTDPLVDLLAEIDETSAAVQRERKNVEGHDAEREVVRGQLKLRAEGETCPTCGSAMDVDSILRASSAGEHRHG